jgi:hypothetical protein
MGFIARECATSGPLSCHLCRLAAARGCRIFMADLDASRIWDR